MGNVKKKLRTATSKTTKKVAKVQLVLYACTHCDNEIEEVKICPLCKNPMRVIEVKEIFGEEAEKLLEEVSANIAMADNIDSLGGFEETMDDAEDDADWLPTSLSTIYPDSGDDLANPNLSEMLDQLDADDNGEDSFPEALPPDL